MEDIIKFEEKKKKRRISQSLKGVQKMHGDSLKLGWLEFCVFDSFPRKAMRAVAMSNIAALGTTNEASGLDPSVLVKLDREDEDCNGESQL